MHVFARLRRSARVEVVALVGIVVAVAVLTELAPGRKASRLARGRAARGTRLRRRCRRAPRSSTRASSARSRSPSRASRGATTVTLIGPDGTGVDGRAVRVNGVAAAPCGSGCYRAPPRGTGPVARLGRRAHADVRRRRRRRPTRPRCSRGVDADVPRVAHDRLRRDARVVADERADDPLHRSSRRTASRTRRAAAPPRS